MLEPLVPAHARLLYEHLRDERLYKFYAGQPPGSIEELERRYETLATRRSPDGKEIWLNYAVRRSDGVYVGVVQATIVDGVATIGYDIFPQFWRRGYGKAACAELLHTLFGDYGVARASAIVDDENIASVRLLESLRFTLAATGPSADMPGRRDHHYELANSRISALPSGPG